LSGEFELLVAEFGHTGRLPGITESLVVLVRGARERAAGFRMVGNFTEAWFARVHPELGREPKWF
jgi:hypothetical protein